MPSHLDLTSSIKLQMLPRALLPLQTGQIEEADLSHMGESKEWLHMKRTIRIQNGSISTALLCAYSLSTANFLRSSSDTLSSAFSFVALRKILLAISTYVHAQGLVLTYLGTILSPSLPRASNASFQRDTQRHHLQPPLSPIWRRSLPRSAENLRNSSVTSAAIEWFPASEAGTSQ